MPTRMTAADAQFYWMSAKIPNNEFLFYAFGGLPTDFERAVDEVRGRAQACHALTLRVDDGSPLTYPHWVPTAVEPEWVIHHQLEDDSWRGCLDAVVRLAGDQLDIRRAPWRLHLFAPVHGLPGYTGAGTVAVMQFAHALADGARLAAMAGWLFGRAAPVPEVTALSPGFMPWLAFDAARSIAPWCAIFRPGYSPLRSGDPAGVVHQHPARGRPHAAHTCPAPVCASPHGHRRGTGRGVRCTRRAPGRCDPVNDCRGDDG